MVQGRESPAHNPDQPRGGGGRPKAQKPSAQKPSKRPAAHKPAQPKPHKPAGRPTKPERRAKRTAGRDEVVLIWFDDTEFKPLATGGHIH